MNITAILGTRCLFFMFHFHLFFSRFNSATPLTQGIAGSLARTRTGKQIKYWRVSRHDSDYVDQISWCEAPFFFFYLWYLYPFSCSLTQNIGKWESKDIQILLLLYSDIKYPWSQIEELIILEYLCTVRAPSFAVLKIIYRILVDILVLTIGSIHMIVLQYGGYENVRETSTL